MGEPKVEPVLVCVADLKPSKRRVHPYRRWIRLETGYGKGGKHPYDIDLHRCDTAPKIISWLLHLSKKNWVTPTMLHDFAVLACKKAGVEIDWSC